MFYLSCYLRDCQRRNWIRTDLSLHEAKVKENTSAVVPRTASSISSFISLIVPICKRILATHKLTVMSFKSIVGLVVVGLLIATGCQAPAEENTLATSSGFSPEGGPVYFGSEASVDLVKDIDKAWANMDMEQLATFFSDTATFEWYDGAQYIGTDAFIERIMADTLDNEWEFRWAYSVDADTEKPGDWVQAGFEVNSSKDSVLVEQAWYHEWYYIEDGKVQYWYNTKAVRSN